MLSERWRALAARISGLTESGMLLAQFLQVNSGEPYGVHKALGTDCQVALSDICAFSNEFAAALPSTVTNRIEVFVATRGDLFKAANEDVQVARAALVLLSSLGTEITYLLDDQQELIRSRVERAFLHLQRLIVANEIERSTWLRARANNEVACERLGAAHLLLHGIFAFKVDATGGRTDLVMPEPIDIGRITRAADGLVLTEWKLIDDNNAIAKFGEGRNQAEAYASGVLGGFELATHRYIVGVSEKNLRTAQSDVERDGVVYRHINLVVDPDVPSVAARK